MSSVGLLQADEEKEETRISILDSRLKKRSSRNMLGMYIYAFI